MGAADFRLSPGQFWVSSRAHSSGCWPHVSSQLASPYLDLCLIFLLFRFSLLQIKIKADQLFIFPPMLSYGHKLHTRAHLRMRFFLHCRETESFISGHLNSRVNTKHMYNRTKAQSESNLTTKYQCTCCSSLHTCPNL